MWKKILNIFKNPLFLLSLILILGLALRLLDVSKTSFWYDEAFTGDIIKLSWKDMFTVIAADKVHPPLFYVLIRCWSLIFGVTQLSLRGFSIFFGLGTIVLTYALGKNLFNKDRFPITGLLLALVVSISPFFIAYSIEARAYSFIAFLSLALAFLVLKLLNSKGRKEIISYLLLSLLVAGILCCTHYLQIIYILAIVCASVIYSLIFTSKGLNKKWLYIAISLIILLVLALCFLPLKELVAKLDITAMWWIPNIKITEIVRVYYSYFLGVVRYMDGVPPVRELIISVPTLIFGGLMFVLHSIGYVLVLISKQIDLEDKRRITFFFFLALVTFVGFYLLGILNFNCFVERYTIAGGIILLISFWMILVTLLKKWQLLIPLFIYICFLIMLKPMQIRTDYRDVAYELDGLNNVGRYIFVEPADMINSTFYMQNHNIYYLYEFKGEYPGWALLNEEKNGLSIEQIVDNDILVVPEYDIEKYTGLGFVVKEEISNGYVLFSK